MISTMVQNNRPKFDPESRTAKIFAVLLALLVWQAAAYRMHNALLLVGPIEVAVRLGQLVLEPGFWQAAGFTFSRITLGFLLAFALALVLAGLSARFPLVNTLLRPYMTAVQTVPVASFIVIALLWLSGRKLSIFIAFLMVLPVLYANFLQGIRSADRQLLEMASIFRMPLWNRVRCIYTPALRPYVLSACRASLGLCWKAGVAAEVIGVCSGSIGGSLYEAKVYLEIGDLFAWTLVIVLISAGFEKCFLFLLKKALQIMEGT